ncbi:MAG: fasciclin domain-containing protein [Bacteroidota bacterium]
MPASLKTFLYLLFACLIGLTACQEPPPFIFVGDQRPEVEPDIYHPCVNYDESENFDATLLEAISSRSDGTRFLEWVKRAEALDPHFYDYFLGQGTGPVTVLMPDNAAIERFEMAYPDIFEDTDRFLALLKHHVLLVNVAFKQMQNDGFQPAMNREPMEFKVTDNYCVIFEEQALLTLADDFSDRDIIHLVDGVIIPNKGF